jgi:hypothetical protein
MSLSRFVEAIACRLFLVEGQAIWQIIAPLPQIGKNKRRQRIEGNQCWSRANA